MLKSVLEMRKLIKNDIRAYASFDKSGFENKVPMPDKFLNPIDESKIIKLEIPSKEIIVNNDVFYLFRNRSTKRKYSDKPLSIEQLNFILYNTLALRSNASSNLRACPSGGNRQSLETYLYINNIDGLEKGVYRYLPIYHALELITKNKNIDDILEVQKFWKDSAVMFFWVAVPERTEWKYVETAAKLILLDAGHVCQNLYLTSEALGLGSCAIGAFNQEKVDSFLELDSKNMFVVYAATVGNI